MATNAPTNEPGVPEAAESQLLGQEVQQILDQIDRPKLMADKRLIRVRHPLLQAQLGADVALNTEIHNMVMALVIAITIDDSIANKRELVAQAEAIEVLLPECAKDQGRMSAAISVFSQCVRDEHIGRGVLDAATMVEAQLRTRLELPNTVQDMVTYPAVTRHTLGESPTDVLNGLRITRTNLENVFAHSGMSSIFKKECDAVEAWFTEAAQNGAQQGRYPERTE